MTHLLWLCRSYSCSTCCTWMIQTFRLNSLFFLNLSTTPGDTAIKIEWQVPHLAFHVCSNLCVCISCGCPVIFHGEWPSANRLSTALKNLWPRAAGCSALVVVVRAWRPSGVVACAVRLCACVSLRACVWCANVGGRAAAACSAGHGQRRSRRRSAAGSATGSTRGSNPNSLQRRTGAGHCTKRQANRHMADMHSDAGDTIHPAAVAQRSNGDRQSRIGRMGWPSDSPALCTFTLCADSQTPHTTNT